MDHELSKDYITYSKTEGLVTLRDSHRVLISVSDWGLYQAHVKTHLFKSNENIFNTVNENKNQKMAFQISGISIFIKLRTFLLTKSLIFRSSTFCKASNIKMEKSFTNQ